MSDIYNGGNQLVKYVFCPRRKNRKGMLIALEKDGKVGFGYSMCRPTDKFDRDRAYHIAKGRAMKSIDGDRSVLPRIIVEPMAFMQEKAEKYFSDKTVLEPNYGVKP